MTIAKDMIAARPLFVTGTARSGSTLLARLLAANPDIVVASDPYFPLFRSLRNAIGRRAVSEDPGLVFDPSSPFQDYYFTRERIRLMDAIQDATLSLPFDRNEWHGLADALRARAAHECPDLVPLVKEVSGPTYLAIFERALGIIASARDPSNTKKWIGLKEVWIVELFKPLAKAFPDAKFLVLLRHPAATINSDLAALRASPSGVGHPLSSARQWRKHVAFAEHYREDPVLAGRLMVIRYEDVVHDPEATSRDLCRFLEVGYDPSMLDTRTYLDPLTGTTWKGNSSFQETVSGIDKDIADRWMTTLDPRVADMIELACGHDMRLAGYEPRSEANAPRVPPADVLRYVIESGRRSWGWRTDFGDPQRDHGYELFRRALLDLPEPPVDVGLIRRSFLFEDVYAKLRQVDASASWT